MKITRISLFITLCLSDSAGTSQELPVKNRWYAPDGLVANYAGGFGIISTGPLFKPNYNFETAITVGYVPPVYGNIWTANIFASYTLIEWNCTNRISFNFLKTGAFVNFNFGKNIHLAWPDNYPSRYYWWNSSVRAGPFIENEIYYKPKSGNFIFGVNFHCNTNDLYFASYIANTKTIPLHEILVFGMGLKIIRKK